MGLRNTQVIATWVSKKVERFEDAWMNGSIHFYLIGGIIGQLNIDGIDKYYNVLT
jgi:hypothetical protein